MYKYNMKNMLFVTNLLGDMPWIFTLKSSKNLIWYQSPNSEPVIFIWRNKYVTEAEKQATRLVVSIHELYFYRFNNYSSPMIFMLT